MTCCKQHDGVVKSNDDKNALTETVGATHFPFMVEDADGNLSLKSNDNFNFKTAQFNYEEPVSEELNQNIGELKNYLQKNPNKSLNITGYYTSAEENTSMYPNLGIARASAVKNYFVHHGISSKNMNLFGELKEDIHPDENGVYNGIVAFGISTKDETNVEDMSKLLEEIQADPLVLYFQTGKSEVSLTNEQKVKLAKIAKYLDKVEGSKCLVIGHTDNTGNANKNKTLGQKRADLGKQYLVKNAILDTKIETISKGQTQPIATNDTEEGKAKNRRTEITIKK